MVNLQGAVRGGRATLWLAGVARPRRGTEEEDGGGGTGVGTLAVRNLESTHIEWRRGVWNIESMEKKGDRLRSRSLWRARGVLETLRPDSSPTSEGCLEKKQTNNKEKKGEGT